MLYMWQINTPFESGTWMPVANLLRLNSSTGPLVYMVNIITMDPYVTVKDEMTRSSQRYTEAIDCSF